jgi:predicted transcriptional regulator
MNLSKEIANWVKNDAPFLNRSAVCRAAKIDRSNFDKFIKMGYVPERHIALLSQVLSKYGFKPTLETVVAENNKPKNKKKIEGDGKTVIEDANNGAILKDTYPETDLRQSSIEEIKERISALESELKNPPKTAIIGIRQWTNIRETELTKLKKQLNLK